MSGKLTGLTMFVTPKYKSDNYRFSLSKANSGPWAVEIGDVFLEAIGGES